MNKEDILKILEGAKDKNGDVPMRLVRQAFEKLSEPCEDAVSRQTLQKELALYPIDDVTSEDEAGYNRAINDVQKMVLHLPSAQPNLGKYEYHYDHTDCIWYRPEARNRCPVTCAQYRDGWNDAMNYIFRDGKGYMPYRRDKQYGE